MSNTITEQFGRLLIIVTTIAKVAQGMTGNTALAFGRTSVDQTSVYVTTNGGMSLPLATGVETAKVVRLEVGIEGVVFGEFVCTSHFNAFWQTTLMNSGLL